MSGNSDAIMAAALRSRVREYARFLATAKHGADRVAARIGLIESLEAIRDHCGESVYRNSVAAAKGVLEAWVDGGSAWQG